MSIRKTLTIIALLLPLVAIANAQQRPPRSSTAGLLVESTFAKKGVPSYQQVTYRDSQVTKGSWTSRFDKIPGWQLPEGELPILAVRVYPFFVGETVSVEISVLRGKKHIDDEDMVATYTLRENEKASVEELRQFGIEPIQIRLFRINSLAGNLPAIENNTRSLEVVGIEPLPNIIPSYKLILHNVSDKGIQAIMLNVAQGPKVLSTGMPQGLEGKPLIAPGESIEWRLQMLIRGEGVKGSKVPAVLMDQRIVIPGLRFVDGTVFLGPLKVGQVPPLF